MTTSDDLSALQNRILNIIQSGFPISPDPYGDLARAIATDVPCTRDEVYQAVRALRRSGVIRRIGGSFAADRLGYVSTLAAAKVDPDALDAAAARAGAHPQVTHDYQREGDYNLWFTVTASGQERIEEILDDVRACPGVHCAYALPALKTFKIRVEFDFDEDEANA